MTQKQPPARPVAVACGHVDSRRRAMSFSGVSSRGKRIAAWMTVMIAMVASSSAGVHGQEVSDATAPSALSQMLHGMNPVNWKLPDLRQVLPGNQEQARIKEKKDGLFSEVGKATSNSWNKTKQMFNPQKLNPVRFLPASSRTPSGIG